MEWISVKDRMPEKEGEYIVKLSSNGEFYHEVAMYDIVDDEFNFSLEVPFTTQISWWGTKIDDLN